MERKITLMLYLLLISSICIITSCNETTDSGVRTNALFYYINETSEIIVLDGCGFGNLINSGDTLVVEHSEVYEGGSPDVNNYIPAPSSSCQMIYGNTSKCERGIYFIDNYEDRKKIGESNFEFTFRFTEEKLQQAESCD